MQKEMAAKCQQRTFDNSFPRRQKNAWVVATNQRTWHQTLGQFASKTGKAAFPKTCWVAPPNIHCLNRLCV